MKVLSKEAIIYTMPIPLIVASLFIGPSDSVTACDILHWLSAAVGLNSAGASDTMVSAIVYNIRLPRALLSFMIGAALAVSGNSMQALFRNPLVSPDILGLASGAAFGAAAAVAYPILPLQVSAFLGGLAAVFASYLLARSGRGVSTVSLVLSGVIVTGIFTALLTLVQFLTDPFRLQTIVHWTMGNLHNASWSRLNSSALPVLISVGWLFIRRWKLNVIAMGDDETRSVGLNPELEKIMVLLPATLAASASVAVAGIIGMVGLTVPHMVRMLVGPDNRRTQPVSIAFGGSFLLLVDNLSRTVASFEIPIGIFTTLVGGPFFVYLLKRGRMLYREA